MHSRTMRCVAGGIMALALMGVGVGVAAGKGGHRAKWITVTDTWVLDAVSEAEVFVAPDGSTTPPVGQVPPPGSMFFFRDEIFAAADLGTAKGARLGTSFGNCTVGTAGALCEVHVSITDRGTIEAKFAFAFTDVAVPGVPLPTAITGGTGEFAGISGEALVYDSDAEVSRLELKAVVPQR